MMKWSKEKAYIDIDKSIEFVDGKEMFWSPTDGISDRVPDSMISVNRFHLEHLVDNMISKHGFWQTEMYDDRVCPFPVAFALLKYCLTVVTIFIMTRHA